MTAMPDNLTNGCVAEKGVDFGHFQQRAHQTRTPLVVGFALTHRCSFSCLHCYLGSQKEIARQRQNELDTGTALLIIDEIAESGTLFLTLTGGDPMLRPDFVEIYEHAVQLGLLVSVYCNGSLINKDIIRSFKQYPPRNVEVSVYGADRAVFARITQVDDGYTRFRRGLDLLRDNNIRFRLKTVVMTLNVEQFTMIQELAAEYGVPFYHDCSLIPCLDSMDNNGQANSPAGVRGLTAPMEYRLPPEQAARIDSSSGQHLQSLQAMLEQQGKPAKPDNRLYQCGAGQTGFHVDAYGGMYPCLVSCHVRYDLRNGTVRQGWDSFAADFRERQAPDRYPCLNCQYRPVCSGCPSAFKLSSGAETKIDRFYCAYAEQRMAKATA